MKIQISKPTPLAEAPDALCNAINQYTEHYAFMSNDQDAYPDIIHFNNAFWKTDAPAVIQYHSEPNWPGLMLDCPYKKLVIAQYHATLNEYLDCQIVRNLINFHDKEYEIRYVAKPRIGYSPSSKKKVGEWHDKGYERTCEILSTLAERAGVEVDIITDVSLEECIKRKSECSLIIDECITGSYHRSALEGLALGKEVVCYLSPAVSRVVFKACGSYLPVVSTYIDGLKESLLNLLKMDLNTSGFHNRLWMIHNWHPVDIVNEYIKIYEGVLNAK